MPSPPRRPLNQTQQARQDRNAYIPAHVQQAMAKQMEQKMPAHMKKYVGAYMQQNVVTPNTGFRPDSHVQAPHVVAPHLPRADNFHPTTPALPPTAASPQPMAPPPATAAATAEQPTQHPGEPYGFIMHPDEAPRKSALPGGNSLPMRALFVAAGLTVLLIAFLVVRSLFGGGTNLDSFVTVAQDQQAIIHLVKSADLQEDLSTTNKNFAATAELSLSSSQTQLVQYLSTNNKKIDVKQLNLKVDAQTDERLKTAAAATTYNQTFREILNNKLTDYVSDLQTTYNNTDGEKGRALLSNDYNQAQLLITQLNGSAND